VDVIRVQENGDVMTLFGEVRTLFRRFRWLILVAPVVLLPAIAALFIKLVQTNQNMGVVVVGLPDSCLQA
jgi:hypothetical protein